MLLDNKVAIVTGGDSGIGRAISIELAKEGAAVTINFRHNEQAANEVKQQIEQAGGKALVVQGDVSSVADLQTLVDRTVETFGWLDIMVNNAGMETRTSTIDIRPNRISTRSSRSISRGHSSGRSSRRSR